MDQFFFPRLRIGTEFRLVEIKSNNPFFLYLRMMLSKSNRTWLNLIEFQWTDFSKSPEVPENLRFLFVRIFLRIGHGHIHRKAPNGQIAELEKFREL